MTDPSGPGSPGEPEPGRDPELERLFERLAPRGDPTEDAWAQVARRIEPARRRRVALVSGALGLAAAAVVAATVFVSRTGDDGPTITRPVVPAATTPPSTWASTTSAPADTGPTTTVPQATTPVCTDPATTGAHEYPTHAGSYGY